MEKAIVHNVEEGSNVLSAWLGISEVARHLGVSDYTVRREIKRGRLAAIRVGKAIRISRADLERYVSAAAIA